MQALRIETNRNVAQLNLLSLRFYRLAIKILKTGLGAESYNMGLVKEI